jgi:[ribosomal protein S5]-alanine N-acetyltransferase
METSRLILRKPRHDDAEVIFYRYASDPEVTRWLGWPKHESLDDTLAFLEFCNIEWKQWPGGPYLIESRKDGSLLGSTGFGFETVSRAATGYVLAKDAWGKGYATEALQAIIDIAHDINILRLYALCHIENAASWHILEKCGFAREGVLRQHSEFPNLKPGEPLDVLCYSLIL